MRKTAFIAVFILCFAIAALALEKLQNSTGTVINPATSDNQTNGNQKTQVTSVPTVTANIYADVVVDVGNSTTSTLTSNATFTGTAFDMLPYASYSVDIYSDQASATNGVKIQWSIDGINWDFSDIQTHNAAVGNMITFGHKARYVRLVYTNGAIAQGSFRVAAYAQRIAVRQTRKFVGNQLTDQDTGQAVIAALQGHTTAGGGSWVDVKVNPSGALTVDATSTTLSSESTVTAIASNQTNGNQVVKGNVTAADGKANPTAAIESVCYMEGWNASTWDKLNSGGTSGSAISTQARGVLSVRNFGYIFNGTNWDPLKGDATNGLDIDVTRTATSHGKTVLYTMISQVSAGTTTIATASASNKHKVVGVTLSMDAAGTLKFSDSSGDLTGALPLAANTPYTLPTSLIPYFETGAVNRLVSLTTTTGKAFGVVQYITEP